MDNCDVHGQAIYDYLINGTADKLWVHNNYGDKEEMPVEVFFREAEDLTLLEQKALELCEGKILDIGAGAGAFSLILQSEGKNVTALENSPLCCKTMKEIGVNYGVEGDIYDYNLEQYDTILLIMNGLGLAGRLKNLQGFIMHLFTILKPGGKIVFDSSDVSYLFDDLPNGVDYFGDLQFQFEYKNRKGEWFDWLYLDIKSLKKFSSIHKFKLEIIHIDQETSQYLATIQKPT